MLSPHPHQQIRVAHRTTAGALADLSTGPVVVLSLIDGVAADIDAGVSRLGTGIYALTFDASAAELGQQVEIVYSGTDADGPLSAVASDTVTEEKDMGVPVGYVPVAPIAEGARIVFVGNSLTQNFGSLPSVLERLLANAAGMTITAGPPVPLGGEPAPPNGNGGAGGAAGWFSGQGLDNMFPAIGQIDAIDPPYTHAVFTSAFGGPPLPLGVAHPSGDNLDYTREFIDQVAPLVDHVLINMTNELRGIGRDTPEFYDDYVEDQVQRARVIEAEYPNVQVVPAAYVWWYLQRHSPPTTWVPPREGWLNMTHYSPGLAQHVANGHQGFLGTVVNAETWMYATTRVSPVGNDEFADPTNDVPSNTHQRPDRSQVYIGPFTPNFVFADFPDAHAGNPVDAASLVDWNPDAWAEMQAKTVLAVDEYYARATPFD